MAETAGSALSAADFDARLCAALAAYDDDRLLCASRLLSALRVDLATSAPAPLGPQLLARLEAHERVRVVEREMEDVRKIYDELHDERGWVNCYEGASTRVDYRQEDDKASHSMRAEGIIHAPLKHVAALLNEPDLFPSVFWFVSSVRVLGSCGRFRRSAEFTLFVPPPLYHRYVRLFGFAVDGLDEEDCVLIVSRDLRDSDGIETDACDDDTPRRTVRAKVHFSMFELKPVSPGVTKVRLIANSDPSLSYVPMTLVNWGSRFVMRFSLRVLEARARNIMSLPHAERLSNPIYDFIDQRLLSYWAAKGYSEDDYRQGGTHRDDASDDFDDSPPDVSKASSLISYSSQTFIALRRWGSGFR